jgi:K(+)-stimulated pyrophosphate-energized sodium pump
MFELTLITVGLMSIVCGILGMLFAFYSARKVTKHEMKSSKVKKITSAIREGAMAFMKRQYKTIAYFAVAVFAIFVLMFFLTQDQYWLFNGFSFVSGAIFSGISGWLGMDIATRANGRTAEAAKKSLNDALQISFSSGTVMGMAVAGMGVIGVVVTFILFLVFQGYDTYTAVSLLMGFGAGASLIALFARVGGGIFTKSADTGADLVGKVEENIPEDDYRNPAVVADLVGDNVGDVAGLGTDLFDSFVNSFIVAITLGFFVMASLKAGGMENSTILFPILVAGAGVISSMVGRFVVKIGGEESIEAVIGAINKGTVVSLLVFLCLTLVIAFYVHPAKALNLTVAVASGIVVGVSLGYITEYYTSETYSHTKDISIASQTGAANTVITGLSVGMISTVLPVLLTGGAVLVAFYSVNHVYGVSLAALGMLSLLGITLSADAYGPVADNAGGIVEMSEMPAKVRKRTDILDSIGNTTAATGKGFAIGCAALTVLSLIVTYILTVEEYLPAGQTIDLSLSNPPVLVGLLVGGMFPFLFSSMVMRGVGKGAEEIIKEVRRQFKDGKIMKGKKDPEYAKCVDISAKFAIKEMMKPVAICVFSPVLFGILIGPAGLGGLLIGGIVSGFVIALQMANSGGAMDNAKKYIESGHLGGPGSETHHAAIIGDLVGDPLKDTAGPSLNTLLTLMNVIAILFIPLIVQWHPLVLDLVSKTIGPLL